MSDPFPPSDHRSHPLKEIIVNYTPENDTIALTYDDRGGARWRTAARFQYGTLWELMKCPEGNTSGLNFNIYLSSFEGDWSQDEIDFEFLGKDKYIVQTNYYTAGTGNREEIHDMGFDSSDGFHEYMIKWHRDYIEWINVDKLVRIVERKEDEGFPEMPMFLYASILDASYIDEARWTGPYIGCDSPYVSLYHALQNVLASISDFSSILLFLCVVSWVQ